MWVTKRCEFCYISYRMCVRDVQVTGLYQVSYVLDEHMSRLSNSLAAFIMPDTSIRSFYFQHVVIYSINEAAKRASIGIHLPCSGIISIPNLCKGDIWFCLLIGDFNGNKIFSCPIDIWTFHAILFDGKVLQGIKNNFCIRRRCR